MSSSTKKPSSAVGKAGGSSPKRRSKSPTKPDSPGKGKGKVPSSPRRKENRMVDDDEDDEDDDDDEEGEDDEDDEDDDDDDDEDDAMDEDEDEDEDEDDIDERIDPSAILGRRTRGKRVDYNSPQAHEKAGLKPGDDE